MDETQALTELQLDILRVLWDRGEANVNDVREVLGADNRDLAATTIATMLSRLEKRGVVTHRSVGRQYIYKALVSEQKVRRSALKDVTKRLFRGDTTALLNHLLTAREMSPGDLAKARALIEEKEREAKHGK
jgi:predicted transcriptional regulator